MASKQTLKNYYELLGISQNADEKTIKKAFRKIAKEKHPDSGTGSDESMRIIIEAYKILSDPSKRFAYDHLLKKQKLQNEPKQFDYREWLRERLDKPEYIVKLIFYDLLHDMEDEALELYETIKNNPDARFERFFERAEAMDAEFCIAEEYIKRQRYHEAFLIIKQLVVKELQKPTFGYFFDVIISALKYLLEKELKKYLRPEEIINELDFFSTLLPDYDFQKWQLKVKAGIYKKNKQIKELAAVHYKLGILNSKKQQNYIKPNIPLS
mgnify:FL=1